MPTTKRTPSAEPVEGVAQKRRRTGYKSLPEITTMRLRRTTRDKLAKQQQRLGVSSLDEALAAVLWRQDAYEAITRLKADTDALTEYQEEAREWAETDVEVREP